MSAELVWRPLAASDADALSELINAAEEVDHTGEYYSVEDAAELLADPNADLARASVGAFDGGTLAGYVLALVKPQASEVHRVTLDGTVRPSHRRRGIGTRLLRDGLVLAQAAHERLHPGMAITVDVQRPDHTADAHALYEAEGFEPVRYYQDMRHPLGAAIQDVPVPAGFRIEAWSPDNDAEFFLIRNESFLDHWGSTPVTAETWRQRRESPAFRPGLTFLLRDETAGRAAAILITNSYAANTEATGLRDAWIATIGTLRDYRKRGAASALISQALKAAQAQGYDLASLGVDSANPTGAFGVYERAGFVPHLRNVRREWRG